MKLTLLFRSCLLMWRTDLEHAHSKENIDYIDSTVESLSNKDPNQLDGIMVQNRERIFELERYDISKVLDTMFSDSWTKILRDYYSI